MLLAVAQQAGSAVCTTLQGPVANALQLSSWLPYPNDHCLQPISTQVELGQPI